MAAFMTVSGDAPVALEHGQRDTIMIPPGKYRIVVSGNMLRRPFGRLFAMSLTDLDRFKAACAYPGKLDEQAVERELGAFLRALGMRRRIVRLRAGWRPQDDPRLNRDIERILAEGVKRNLGFRAIRAVLAPVRAVLPLRAAWRLRATLDGDFASAVGTYRAADDALAGRHASDAGIVAAAVVAGRGHAAAPAAGASWSRRALALLVAAGFAAASSDGGFLAILGIPALLTAFSAVGGRDDAGVFTGLAASALVALGFGAFLALGAYPGATLAALAGAGLAALAARPGLVARADAVHAFAAFAVDPEARALRTNWRGSVWELSWSVGALFERRKPAVEAWLRPLFEAFVCGCWLIYWADDALYWVAKPTVHREPGTQRLHHDTRAALESDIVNLYFWRGVMVPSFVILRPDRITIARIDRETNAEVRRVMIERYRHGEEIHGAAAFIRDAGGMRRDHDERYGTLWGRNIPHDEVIMMIEVVNRTREPDGSFKRYWLRVPPTMRTAREAVAWTFNMPAERYAPGIET